MIEIMKDISSNKQFDTNGIATKEGIADYFGATLVTFCLDFCSANNIPYTKVSSMFQFEKSDVFWNINNNT